MFNEALSHALKLEVVKAADESGKAVGGKGYSTMGTLALGTKRHMAGWPVCWLFEGTGHIIMDCQQRSHRQNG
jgi:hypothetical protein